MCTGVLNGQFGQNRGGDVARLVEHQTGMPLTQAWFPGVARDFSPRINFQCRLAYGVCTPPRGITCINICAHIKDCVLHVRVWWILKTLKHWACTVDCIARLWCSWFSLGKATPKYVRNPCEKSQWDDDVVKNKILKSPVTVHGCCYQCVFRVDPVIDLSFSWI